MHHLPVQRKGPLTAEDHDLLELCAEGWSVPVIANLLGLPHGALAERLDMLCSSMDVPPRPDGQPPVHAARLWLVHEAQSGSTARAA